MSANLRVAIIDPVGKKAGMDHYDLLLLEGMQKAGAEVELYSNFSKEENSILTNHVFHNIGVGKLSAISSNFFGFLKALRDARHKKIQWLIVHVFRAGLFDLVTFSIARMMGFRICAIIHDIESLDTYSLPLIRKIVIQHLPKIRTVHNEFSRKELQATFKNPSLKTYVIPHVNFTDLFSDKKEPETTLAAKLHPALQEVVSAKIPVFVFFGQIKDAKGLDVLFEAACQLKGDFRIIIAGKVREGSWSHYEQMIRALNLKEKILPAIRHIEDAERDYLFSIAQAVVLPYKKIYQSGVLLMAMSYPALVIVSALPPNREIVEDNHNGLLFNAGSSPDLARRMQEVLDGRINRDALQTAALRRMEDFSPEKIGLDYLKILR